FPRARARDGQRLAGAARGRAARAGEYARAPRGQEGCAVRRVVRAVAGVLVPAAVAACGGATPEPGPGPAWFVEEAHERGLDFTWQSGHAERHYFPEIMGGGAALLDVEEDGDLDVYLVQAGSITAPPEERPGNQLFANDGAGRFTDKSAGSGADEHGYSMGVAAGDADEDGRTDLYVTNVGPNVLFASAGDGTFRDVTAAAGVGDPSWSTSAAFVDYDGDGDLDLFVANYIRWS